MLTLDGDLVPGIAFGRERFVLWRWDASPLGPLSVLGRVGPDGRLTVYSAAPAAADLIAVWHRVHDVRRGPVRIERRAGALRVVAEPLDAAEVDLSLALGATRATRALEAILALTPPLLAGSAWLARAAGPVAGVALGLGASSRLAGRTETGASVHFAVRRIAAVTGGRARVGGRDLGAMASPAGPLAWGDLGMPRAAHVLGGRLSVDAPLPDLVRSSRRGADAAPARAPRSLSR